MRGTRIAALIVASLSIPLSTTPSWACSCASVGREELAAEAKIVFTGRAVHVARTETELAVRFRVTKVYKGQADRRVDVVTPPNSAACGCSFKEGNVYTVFGTRRKEPVATNLCSGTNRGTIDPDDWGLPPGSEP